MKSASMSPVDLVPLDLIPAIEEAAAAERRTPRELVGEAVQRYLAERRIFRPSDVHQKIAEGLASLRQGKGLDGETVMADLLAEFEPPIR